MGVLPPLGSALGESVICGEFIPFQVCFGQAYNVYLTFGHLFSYCAVFGVISLLGETVDIYGKETKCMFLFFFISSPQLMLSTLVIVDPPSSSTSSACWHPRRDEAVVVVTRMRRPSRLGWRNAKT